MEQRQLRIAHFVVVVLASLFFVSCRKSVDRPAEFSSREVAGFHVSESRLVLLQGNAANRAVVFSWDAGGPTDTYTIEADVSADFFDDPIEIMTTKTNSVSFSVNDFNDLMCKLLCTNNTGKVDFRVKLNHSGAADTVYSAPTAMVITTYRNYLSFDESNTIKVPGNYQGWNVATAPKIVAAEAQGEYEGYVNFANPSPQILLVKGNQWDVKNTYSYIGNGMFGFGGSIMDVQGGAGVYLIKANTNNNKWSSTKITDWDIAGDAADANTKATMGAQEEDLTWSVTMDLKKGNFRIRANNSDALSFGHKSTDEQGVPSYDGDDMVIKRNGNYTITLSLTMAGNYSYTITRNS